MRTIIPQTACIAITFIIRAYLYINSFSYAHLHLYAHTETPRNPSPHSTKPRAPAIQILPSFLVHGNQKVNMPNGTWTGLGAVQTDICCESGKGNWSKCPWGLPHHSPVLFPRPCRSCDLAPGPPGHVAVLALCPTEIAPCQPTATRLFYSRYPGLCKV